MESSAVRFFGKYTKRKTSSAAVVSPLIQYATCTRHSLQIKLFLLALGAKELAVTEVLSMSSSNCERRNAKSQPADQKE